MPAARHSWSDPYRTQHLTERRCWACGLMRVTRHEPGILPWTEFWRDGVRIEAEDGSSRTPSCPGERRAA